MDTFQVKSLNELENLVDKEDFEFAVRQICKASSSNLMVKVIVGRSSYDSDYYFLEDVYIITSDEYNEYKDDEEYEGYMDPKDFT